jgi:hypothetical protein
VIAVLLRDLARRLPLVAGLAVVAYLLEPGFHEHGIVVGGSAASIHPAGISATVANLALFSTLLLLGGFISTDRSRGYAELHLSHPASPLALYGLRWALGVLLALGVAAIFLVVGQLLAWGELRVGAVALLFALAAVLAYGGLLAFLSAVLPRADGWTAALLFLATYLWWFVLGLGAEPLPRLLRQAVSLLLPPHHAFEALYQGAVSERMAWDPFLFSAGYGIFWLILAGVVLRRREWS